jgi:hypothetical protein
MQQRRTRNNSSHIRQNSLCNNALSQGSDGVRLLKVIRLLTKTRSDLLRVASLFLGAVLIAVSSPCLVWREPRMAVAERRLTGWLAPIAGALSMD